jgi:hypothetical protein
MVDRPHNQGGEASPGVLTIALRGFPLEVFAAFLDGGCDRPPRCLTLHDAFRAQAPVGRQAIIIAMGSCPILDIDPTDFPKGCAEAVPVPCARDDLEVSGGSPIPRPPEASACGGVCPDGVGGGQLLALHARAAHGPARPRGRRHIQGGIALHLAHEGAGLVGFAATPRGLAGPIARVAHKDTMPLRKPAPQARPSPPGEVRWRLLPRTRPAIPRRGPGQGRQDGEGPGPGRERDVDQHRPDDPRMAPAGSDIPVGRAHPLTMPARAPHARARLFRDRLIARQQHRARRDDMVQQERAQQPSPRPGRPPAGEKTR